tara:strand:- start:186 stop:497 length:312 start_codon:yes stop_codon:yes gene_type:complete
MKKMVNELIESSVDIDKIENSVLDKSTWKLLDNFAAALDIYLAGNINTIKFRDGKRWGNSRISGRNYVHNCSDITPETVDFVKYFVKYLKSNLKTYIEKQNEN